MAVFVTEPSANGKRMLKTQRVTYPYDQGDQLDYLIEQHQDCIYFTDNEAEFFGTTMVSVTEQMDTTYDVWSRDLHNPESMPTPHRENLGGLAVAQNWAKDFNRDEAYRGRYQFFAVKVTTTRKFEEV